MNWTKLILYITLTSLKFEKLVNVPADNKDRPMALASGQFELTIGVYAPTFQGPFIGEIANQIRQYCQLRGYRYIGFCTGGFNEFNCALGVDSIDCAVIIRNCVSNDFVEALLGRNIATVSIAYDYFPLAVPVISSNNEKGAELAFHHLKDEGHRAIAFIGDLSQYDIRKRFERYSELMNEFQFELSDDLIINVSNTDISGGIEAANQFVTQDCKATAVFCTAGFTTIGFVKGIKEKSASIPNKLSIVGHDAMPLMSVLCPKITVVDQNVHIIAYRAVSTVIDMINNKKIESTKILVEPKLIKGIDLESREENPYLATSVDISEIFNPCYISALLNNNFVWVNEIFDTRLEKLMSISPMFEKYMKLASFTRLQEAPGPSQKLKLMKLYYLSRSLKFGGDDASCLCEAADFPPQILNKISIEKYNNSSHFFIKNGNKFWGVISLFGDSQKSDSLGSYLYLSGQMEILVKMVGMYVENQILKQSSPEGKNVLNDQDFESTEKHTVAWSISDRLTEWSDGALALLDFNSVIDRNIYRQMDITDRVHEDDMEELRGLIAECAIHKTLFSKECHFKTKSGKFVTLRIDASNDKQGSSPTEKVIFHLGYSETH